MNSRENTLSRSASSNTSSASLRSSQSQVPIQNLNKMEEIIKKATKQSENLSNMFRYMRILLDFKPTIINISVDTLKLNLTLDKLKMVALKMGTMVLKASLAIWAGLSMVSRALWVALRLRPTS